MVEPPFENDRSGTPFGMKPAAHHCGIERLLLLLTSKEHEPCPAQEVLQIQRLMRARRRETAISVKNADKTGVSSVTETLIAKC
jgi:hypothetical protein